MLVSRRGFWFGGAVAAITLAIPVAYYRNSYTHAKRLRVVTPGRFYRSGQLTADGFREAVRRFDLKTVINLQEEDKDPYMPVAWLGRPSVLESDLCRSLGVRYVSLDGGELVPPGAAPGSRPRAIDDFLRVLDDQSAYPVLIHCKAGLHRTGLMTAIYRMEFEDWSTAAAVREMRANGFGDFACTTENVYLVQFVQTYQKGRRIASAGPAGKGDRP
jgi:tyrosine-protein phosphatase SIW14